MRKEEVIAREKGDEAYEKRVKQLVKKVVTKRGKQLPTKFTVAKKLTEREKEIASEGGDEKGGKP